LGIPDIFVPVDRFAQTWYVSLLVTLRKSTALRTVMDLIADSHFYGEVENVTADDNFNDIFGDFEVFSDTHSESDWSDIGNLDNIQDSMVFDWSNEAYMNNLNNNAKVEPKSLYSVEVAKPSSLTSPFDTNNFPTSVNDISNLIEIDPNFNNIDSIYMSSDCNSLDVSYNISVPVIKIEEHENDDEPDDKEDDDQMKVDENMLQEMKIEEGKARKQRKYSSTDESDEEWAPEPPKYFRRKSDLKRISKTPSRRPVPQRRSPGTKLKITQWIVELLRNPKYNPKVITWIDERQGMFMIKDTVVYAKLWGKVKGNDNMTYEKLSRAMRYSYKNDELRMVPEQRLTYQFGANMINYRAENPEDPNFELLHKNIA